MHYYYNFGNILFVSISVTQGIITPFSMELSDVSLFAVSVNSRMSGF